MCAIAGTIMFAFAVFAPDPIHGNRVSIGEAGITLMGVAIIFAGAASYRP